MQCERFEILLHEVLDRRELPETNAELRNHTQHCSSCRVQMVTTTRLLEALDLLETPALPDEFAKRVVGSIHDSEHIVPKPRVASHRSQSPTTAMLVTAALAVAILLAVVPVGWYVLRGPQTVTRPSTAAEQPLSVEQNLAAVPTSASASLDAPAESWLTRGDTILQLYPEEIRQRHRKQVHQIADDLRPIATPFNAALTAIRRSIPRGKSAPRREPRASLNRPSRARGIS